MIKKAIRSLVILPVLLIISLSVFEVILRTTISTMVEKFIDPEPYKSTNNSQGFRVNLSKRDYVYPENSDKFRIICVGDSFTYGHGVADDETYPVYLEDAIKKKTKYDVEVINAGINGATIIDELEKYRQVAAALNHNISILMLHDNDFNEIADKEIRRMKGWHYNDFESSDKYFGFLKSYKIVKKIILRHRRNRIKKYLNDKVFFRKIHRLYIEKLLEFKKVASVHKAEFYFVIYFIRWDDRPVLELIRKNKINLIYVMDEYQKIQDQDIYLAYHHNKKGNKYLAEIIGESIVKIFNSEQ